MSHDQEPVAEGASPPAASKGRPRGSSIAELFAARPSLDSSPPGPGISKASGSSMAGAMSQAQEQSKGRRLSLTTLGLSGAQPTAPPNNPFGNLRRGSSSYDTARRTSLDSDSAVDDSDTLPPLSPSSSESSARPNGGMSPIGRRFSFGAKAYGDARSGFNGPAFGLPTSNGGGSTAASSGMSDPAGRGLMSSSVPGTSSSPPGMKGKAEGYSWAESLRTRAQRTSISGDPVGGSFALPGQKGRSQSTAASQPAPPPQLSAKPPPKAPDHFQERILKGDFYMD